MKKKLLSTSLKAFLVLFFLAGTTINATAQVIEIGTIEGLDNIRNNLEGDYILLKNLDFEDDASYEDPSNKDDFITGQGWMPIDGFTGTLDGVEHTIANLFIDRIQNNVGFFGTIEQDAVIENLNLVNADVTGSPATGALVGLNNGGTIRNITANVSIETDNHTTGGLVGRNTDGGLIENVSTNGTLTTSNTVIGGIVGRNLNNSIIRDSYSDVDIFGHGERQIGGIAGSNRALIENCYFSGTASGDGSDIGGIAGSNGSDGIIENSYSDATLIATSDYEIGTFYSMGGIAGRNNGNISDSHFTGEFEVSEFGFERVGGIAGWHDDGIIQKSYSTTNIEGNSYTGGLVGRNSGGTISESYSTGNIKGFHYVGGLAGESEGWGASVENCFATGSVESSASGNLYAGGFMGDGGNIYNSYSTGTVTEGDASGGFVGVIAGGSDYENSFWDVETSERTDDPAQEAEFGVEGLPTRGMMESVVYQEWDITVVEGPENSYPMLDLENNYATIWYIIQKPRQTVTFIDEEKLEEASVQVYFDEDLEYKAVDSLETDSEGEASIELQEGSFWFTASAPGYDDYTGDLTVVNENVTVYFSLNETAFQVTINEDNSTENVSVKIFKELDNHYIAAFNEETKRAELYTDIEGKATVNLLNDNYVLLATKDGYMNYYKKFTVDGESVNEAFEMTPITESYTITFEEINQRGGALIEIFKPDPETGWDDFIGMTITDEHGIAPFGVDDDGGYQFYAEYHDGENHHTLEGDIVDFEISGEDKTIPFELKIFYNIDFTVYGDVNNVEITIYSDEERTQQVREPIYAGQWLKGTVSAWKNLEDGEYWFTASLSGYEDYNGHFVVDGESKQIEFELNIEYIDVNLLGFTDGELLHSDATGNLIGVAYNKDGEIYYNSYNTSAESWSDEELIAEGSEARITFDDFGNPHIAYTTSNPQDYSVIGYRMHDGDQWTQEVLIESSANGEADCSIPDICTDSEGNAHITYTDESANGYNDIMYAENSSDTFETTLIKEGYMDDMFDNEYHYYNKGSSIAIDKDDNYFIMTHYWHRSVGMDIYDNYDLLMISEEIGVMPIYETQSNDIFDLYDMYRYSDIIVISNRFENDLHIVGFETEDGDISMPAFSDVIENIPGIPSVATNGEISLTATKSGDYLDLYQSDIPIEDHEEVNVVGSIVRMAFTDNGFFALYNPVVHTVTFDNNEGDTEADPASINVESGNPVEQLPTEPQKEGRNFVEWNSQANGEGEIFSEATSVTDDITVYAIWEAIPTHLVEFNVAQGEGIIEATVDGEPISNGQEILEDSEIVFTATPDEGYQITEWTLNGDVVDEYTESTYTINSLSENTNITVGFELTTHTVTFDNNEGDTEANPSSISVEGGLSVEELPAQPIKDGHIFVEWNTQFDGEGQEFSEETIVTEDITVYAIWEAIPTHLVEFNVAQGEGSVEATVNGEPISDGQEIIEGSEIVFTATPDEGCQITEWTLNGDVIDEYTESTYTINSLSENTNITVGFELTTHTVTFDNNEGDTEADPAAINVQYGSSVEQLPAEPQKEGHIFVEWNSDANGEGEALNETSTITNNVTVYAIWKAITTDLVEFDVAQGEGSIEATVNGEPISDGQEIIEGSEIVFTATPDEGYQITEWTLNGDVVDEYTESTYTINSLSENTNITVGFELTTHTVTFDNNEGDTEADPAAINVQYGSSVEQLPAEPQKEGHIFVEWNSDANGEGEALNETSTITNNVTVYAIWKAITTHLVEFNVAQGEGIIEATVNGEPISDGEEVEQGEDMLFTATPDEGYHVKEWTLNNNVVAGHVDETLQVEDIDENIDVAVKFAVDLVSADPAKMVKISIYPNPANNKITIKSNERIELIKIINIDGKLVKNKTVKSTGAKINVNNLNEGMYFIKIHTNKTVITEKLQVIK